MFSFLSGEKPHPRTTSKSKVISIGLIEHIYIPVYSFPPSPSTGPAQQLHMYVLFAPEEFHSWLDS